ncbi:MAG: helix-turn-helix domain-containing protein [Pseudonocardia sp.]
MAQRPNDLSPQKGGWHLWGAELRSLREQSELSCRGLAKLVNYDPSTVSKAENAIRPPSLDLARACDEVLHTNGTLADLRATIIDSSVAHRSASLVGSPCQHCDNPVTGVNDAQPRRLERPLEPADPIVLTTNAEGRTVYLSATRRPVHADDRDLPLVSHDRRHLAESDNARRRELLRLFNIIETLLAMPPSDTSLDTDRIHHTSDDHPSRLGAAKLDEYAELNSHLWRVFALSISKDETMPLVRRQLDVLIASLRQPHSLATHHRICALAGDLLQLAGEIFFDGDHYTEAAHCYTIAATASKEASAFDLWACAMTRHAFISVYERQFDKAAPMLELAAALAQRGDSSLSTRHWVSAVQAETFAGLGDRDGCERALDLAEQVCHLDDPVHNSGWLRFDGSRLAEERGTCYVALGRPDLAEANLTYSLNQAMTTRRRASVLTDLAMIAVQRSDPGLVVAYADIVLNTAHQTGSGVISRKLEVLQRHLTPLLGDKKIHQLHTQITALIRHTVTR